MTGLEVRVQGQGDETVTVTLSDPTGGPTIGRGIATLRIVDDD